MTAPFKRHPESARAIAARDLARCKLRLFVVSLAFVILLGACLGEFRNGPAFWSSGRIRIGLDSAGGVTTDYQYPPSPQTIGQVTFKYSFEECGGPPLLRDLLQVCRLDAKYEPDSGAATLTKAQQDAALRKVRNDLAKHTNNDRPLPPPLLELFAGNDKELRRFRPESIFHILLILACAACGCIAAALVARWARLRRGLSRLKRRMCPACGYDVRSASAQTCPECGALTR
jgi:hypothetical protein